jgi:hypothetical protein
VASHISALRDDPRLAAYLKKLGLPDPNSLPFPGAIQPQADANL